MKFAVIVFPGSNCDDDMVHVLGTVMGADVRKVWHKDTQLPTDFSTADCVVLPGGFSYGDYVRSGAIARFSPIMQAVQRFAAEGGYVWGICNGFQILCEAGLLPGVLLRNNNQKFSCKNIWLKTETNRSAITADLDLTQILKIPMAHADGRYYADAATLDTLEANQQVLFRYCSPEGQLGDAFNPNGAERHIAGICNAERNVFGMMPHPERAAESVLGNTDGYGMFASLLGKAVAVH
jgi:phosphoribosylformylglycinamidine synthase subunit PurQ / glutaminase